ncbi:uncharacterized protein [Leptinotarsa decemlineata]|uniref:uncharacterized protein n=1 Tax=Leptinotarsa decemlineata TaxID=7539 RepID=UPI003D30BBAB
MSVHSGGGSPPPTKKSFLPDDKNLNYEEDQENITLDELNDREVEEIMSFSNSRATHSSDKETEDDYNGEKREIILYKENDLGPYLVIVEANETSGNNIGRFNHLKIAKDICDLKLNHIIRIKNKGKNKIGIEFNNRHAANDFVTNKDLIEQGYQTFIPYNRVTCKGIIRGISEGIHEKYLKKFIKSPYKVLGVKRMNRKVVKGDIIEYHATSTIQITFEGINLPKHVEICYMSFNIIPFIPPVTHCFNCLMYGHTKKNCKGKRRCHSCAEQHEDEEGYNSCQSVKCFNCKSEYHKTLSKECPEFDRQKKIREKMSLENLSFHEAIQFFPKNNHFNTNNITEFPTLRNRSEPPPNNIITTSQRRHIYHTNTINKRTFSQTIKTSKLPNEMENLNKYLIHPNGQILQPKTGVMLNRTANTNAGTSQSTFNVLHHPNEEYNIIKKMKDLLSGLPEIN